MWSKVSFSASVVSIDKACDQLLPLPAHGIREHLFDLYVKSLLSAGYDEVFPIIRQPGGSSLLNHIDGPDDLFADLFEMNFNLVAGGSIISILISDSSNNKFMMNDPHATGILKSTLRPPYMSLWLIYYGQTGSLKSSLTRLQQLYLFILDFPDLYTQRVSNQIMEAKLQGLQTNELLHVCMMKFT
ncbi:hypothetical protein PILCRDRAFT_88896 [Piloderma croceum F 1598]|uniref:Uncharacterized protein n=1 Tax=Piloderma croceum (strain F 1598) TaxID=765440 RepID=A0A0C3B647_PILCF|nr:hypothetical protein PILCRDRAFT_88896 [Piloderma croceum F 1598]